MQKILEKLEKFFESKVFIAILFIIGSIIIVMLIFVAGIAVGVHKASFERAWGEHYYENFGLPPRNMMNIGGMDDAPNAHGAVGKIIKVDLPSIVMEDNNKTEKVVLINDDTKIQEKRDEIKSADLKVDDSIVVIGAPNSQGQIEAKLIRVIPQAQQ